MAVEVKRVLEHRGERGGRGKWTLGAEEVVERMISLKWRLQRSRGKLNELEKIVGVKEEDCGCRGEGL